MLLGGGGSRAARRACGRAGSAAPVPTVQRAAPRLARLQRVEQRGGDAAAEGGGVDDEPVDVDGVAVALVGDGAEQPVAFRAWRRGTSRRSPAAARGSRSAAGATTRADQLRPRPRSSPAGARPAAASVASSARSSGDASLTAARARRGSAAGGSPSRSTGARRVPDGQAAVQRRIGTSQASASSRARRSSSRRSPDTSSRFAASVVGSSSLPSCSSPALQLVQAGRAERGQQVEAAARGRSPGSASRSKTRAKRRSGRPARVALERGGLRAGAGGPRAVGLGGPAAVAGQVVGRAVRPRGRAASSACWSSGASGPASASRNASHVASSRSGRSAISGYGPGGSSRAAAAASAAARRSASAVARRPGRERVAVAVVGGARDAPGHHAGLRGVERAALRRRARARARARRAGGALAFSSACSSRLQIGQLAVRRLWRQKSDTASWL